MKIPLTPVIPQNAMGKRKTTPFFYNLPALLLLSLFLAGLGWLFLISFASAQPPECFNPV